MGDLFSPLGRKGGAETVAVELIDEHREEMRAQARATYGVEGDENTPPLRRSIRESKVGWYPLLALSLLVMVDELQGYVLGVLGPDIVATLGISRAQFAAAIQIKGIVIVLAALPVAALVQHRARRAWLSIATAIAWSIVTMATGFVVSIWGLVFLLALDGLSTSTVRAIHMPLLVDSYPTSVRVRALAFYRGADAVGNIVAPLLVGVVVTLAGFTWRGAFIAMGVVSLAAALFSLGLRDPGFGRFDTEEVKADVRDRTGVEDGAVVEGEVELSFFEIARRLTNMPTIRRALGVAAVLGVFLVPFTTYMSFYLYDRWSLGAGGRALFSAVMPLFVMGMLLLWGRRGEQLFRRDPAALVRLAAIFLIIASVLIPIGIYSPVFIVMVLCLGMANGLMGALTPSIMMIMMSLVPAKMRPHSAALFGLVTAGVGSTAGLVLVAGLESRFGSATALAVLGIPGVIGGIQAYRLSHLVNDDLDSMLDAIVEEEAIRGLGAQGQRLPMLTCRHVDFSYDQIQVLFDVDFTVDDGEMVALLGTNGAGKSTLLRVIAGLGLPSRGSVRLGGADITFTDPERRLGLGINSIWGGRAVFEPMSVVENLRLYGYTLGRDRRRIEAGIDASFEAFPVLAERRNQQASTLSGGERQMLTLSKAFVVPPRLLVIDELSLGLAPKVVGELLAVVRRINADGTAVILVEQSVNIALSIAQHAYFMEKGEIRFDGRAADLAAREDLLRSVFLHGAAAGIERTRRNGSDT